MAKGLPRHLFKAAIAKIKAGADRSAAFKEAWAQHRGSAPRSKSAKSSNPCPRPRSRTSMARKGKVHRSRGWFNTSKIFKLLRIGALALPAVSIATGPGTVQGKIAEGLLAYTGWHTANRRWEPSGMARGWLPYIGTALVTYGVPKLIAIIRRL